MKNTNLQPPNTREHRPLRGWWETATAKGNSPQPSALSPQPSLPAPPPPQAPRPIMGIINGPERAAELRRASQHGAHAQAVATLAAIREGWHTVQRAGEHTNEQLRRGFVFAALKLITTLEAREHPDELWTSHPTEAELTDQHRLGDHIAVTRTLLGMTA